MANLLFAGGEDSQFLTNVTTIKTSTDTNDFDANVARCALYTDDTYTAYIYPPSFGLQTEGWLHCMCYVDSWSGAVDLFSFYHTGTGQRVAGVKTDASSNVRLHVGGVEVSSTPGTFTLTQGLHFIDIHFIYNNTTGEIVLYVDHSERLRFTGDTTAAGTGGFDSIALYRGSNLFGRYNRYSEIIVTQTDSTIPMRLHTGYPDGLGNYNQFTGSYQDIDEVALDSSDFIYSGIVGEKHTTTTKNVSGAFSNYDVYAVAFHSAFRLSASSNVNDFAEILRENGVDSTSPGLNIPNDSSIVRQTSIYNQHPNGPQPWTRALYDATEFGWTTL